ncbi:hypothetical protein PWT90_04227 [Aphanocladium album]|nr:hypothetical protein PWT90_04227 [Aphanocladium album]
MANEPPCSSGSRAAELDVGGPSACAPLNDREARDAQSFTMVGTDVKNKSPYRGKRVENYASQHNSPSSRTQHGGFNPGGKPFSKKWNPGFRRQENFPTMPESMQRDFSNPGVQRFDPRVPVAGGPGCPNTATGLDRTSYIPCNCCSCAERNRSVWVRVAATDKLSLPVREMQTRVRFGIESRFGRVEEVTYAQGPNPKPGPMNFIVRFASEDSVPQSLAVNNGRIEEQKIKLNISPMFRSKWVLLSSAYQVGNQQVTPESLYRVVKVASQRRGELPFPQDQMMGRGGPVPRNPTGGPFLYNNQPLGQMDPRNFGQAAQQYPGRKPRYPMHAEGNFRGQQPFHAFNPKAQFHGPVIEAAGYQPSVPLPEMLQSLKKTQRNQSEDSLQSRPVAEEALGVVPGAAASVEQSQSGAEGQENMKPRVSLPEKPIFSASVAAEQRQQQGKVAQMASGGLQLPPRPDKSPVRQPKKKRQAAQLRVGNHEGKDTTAAVSTINTEPVVTAVAAAPTSATAPVVAKDKEAHRPSLFTVDEIKDRKQAWDRIAVPLSSPRTQPTPEDALQTIKPGHDRAKSLPVTTTLMQLPTRTDTADDVRTVAKATENTRIPRLAEQEIRFGSDAGQSAASGEPGSRAASASPKKSGKSRKKKNKKDAQSKQPAKKEHKL